MHKLLFPCAILLLSHLSGRTNAVNPTDRAGSSSVSSKIERLKMVQLDIQSLERILEEKREESRLLLQDLDQSQQLSTRRVEKAPVIENPRPRSLDQQADPDIDYLRLSLYWEPFYRRFFIRGLWPSSFGPKNPERCKDYSRENNPDWNLTMIPDGMQEKWKRWVGESSNEEAWKRQWNKHGTCTYKLPGFGSIRKYYENTIKLFDNVHGGHEKSLGLSRTPMQLASQRILKPIDRETLISIVAPISLHKNIKQKHKYMQLVCENSRGLYFSNLVEVRFCYKADSFTKHIECPEREDSCGDLISL